MDDLISNQAAIDVNGLDKEIRCEMCKNPIRTDRGCDGNCKYDEILYEKIIQLLNKRIMPLPSAQPDLSDYSDRLWRNAYERGKAECKDEIVRCRDCRHCYVDGKNVRFNVCDLNHNRAQSDEWYCADAERRTDE